MEATENKPTKTGREMMLARLQERYPEKEYADDEALFSQISDDYDASDAKMKEYQEREKSLSDMFSADPRSAAFLTKWREGGDPFVELVRQFGTDIREALDDPERLEAISVANKDYVERVAKAKELEDLYEKNLQESNAVMDALKAEKAASDEQLDAALALLMGIAHDGIVGKFTRESLEMALKAINHDADVASANQEGLVQGKNTKVETQLRKPGGDGVAPLGGSNRRSAPARPPRDLGALDRFGEGNLNIWERGGEKRRKYD